MQRHVHPLIIIDMDLRLGFRLSFTRLDIRPNDVVLGSDRYPLREFPAMVGEQLPAGFLLVGTADPDGDAVRWFVLRVPHRTEDEGVVFSRLRRRRAMSWDDRGQE